MLLIISDLKGLDVFLHSLSTWATLIFYAGQDKSIQDTEKVLSKLTKATMIELRMAGDDE